MLHTVHEPPVYEISKQVLGGKVIVFILKNMFLQNQGLIDHLCDNVSLKG